MVSAPKLLTVSFLLVAFLLLFLVSLSSPIIKDIYLLQLSANVKEGISIASVTVTAQVKFGVWGYCVSPIDAKVAGQTIESAGQCSSPHLGYTFDSVVSDALQSSNLDSSSLSKGVTTALVLHPIACVLTFLALMLSLLALPHRPSRIARTHLETGLTLAVTLLAVIFANIVTLIDIIFVAVLRSKVKSATDGDVTATWGTGTWMALAATVLLWFASVSSCCGVFTGRRHQVKQGTY